MCREYKTWGDIYCMRDHYYQLFDLEKNFGEKIFCQNVNSDNPNLKLESAIFGSRSQSTQAFEAAAGDKAPEKDTDPWVSHQKNLK